MRILPALWLPALALLGACGTQPDAPIYTSGASTGATCELAAVPPPGAVIGVRDGMNIATYPPQVTRGMTGCQRVWYGEPARRESMQVLATYYFHEGEVRRLTGRVPGGAIYDCHYRRGSLDTAASQNAAQCPKATDLDRH
jgi:hypothetical protein